MSARSWGAGKVSKSGRDFFAAVFANEKTGTPQHPRACEIYGLTREEVEGKVALIAAAPDLLRALKALLEAHAVGGSSIQGFNARAAIAKAEGRAA